MNILITGHKGHIGTEVFKDLKNKYNVKGFDIKQSPKQDLNKYSMLRQAVKGNDIVTHLAAIPHPSRKIPYQDYFDINVKGTFNVAKACHQEKVKRLIYISSTAIYGLMVGSKLRGYDLPLEKNADLFPKSISNKDNINMPQFPYASSKIACESLLATYGLSNKFEVVILRFSPCPPLEKYDAVYNRYGTVMTLQDAVKAINLAIEYKEELWYEIFNISTKGITTVKAKEVLEYE
jgi:nucleoside-diphosphate-sugar epimerase